MNPKQELTGKIMETKLERIADKSRNEKRPIFTFYCSRTRQGKYCIKVKTSRIGRFIKNENN